MKPPRKGLRNLRTLTALRSEAAGDRAHVRLLKAAMLELEKSRRSQEREKAAERIAHIDARLAEIDAELDELLKSEKERLRHSRPTKEEELDRGDSASGLHLRY